MFKLRENVITLQKISDYHGTEHFLLLRQVPVYDGQVVLRQWNEGQTRSV